MFGEVGALRGVDCSADLGYVLDAYALWSRSEADDELVGLPGDLPRRKSESLDFFGGCSRSERTMLSRWTYSGRE